MDDSEKNILRAYLCLKSSRKRSMYAENNIYASSESGKKELMYVCYTGIKKIYCMHAFRVNISFCGKLF